MGYDTEFEGAFNLDKPLTEAHKVYLEKFSRTRRMRRSEAKAAILLDPIRDAVNLTVGEDGGYYVGSLGFMGQDDDESVIDHNEPPAGQPGLWCQWVPNENGTAIEWDGGEKFYKYVNWIKYLIAHFLQPWGYTVNGTVSWRGENFNDLGYIIVTNNEVTTQSR